MAFCKYCGKELVNGVCDCPEALAANVADQGQTGGDYTQNNDPYQTGTDYTQNGGQNMTQDSAGNYSGNDGYSQNAGYGQGNGYGQNTGYGQGDGYGQNDGYDQNDGYGQGYYRSGETVSLIRELFERFKHMTGISDPVSDSYDPFERNVPIVPDCIDAEENEIVVKQYNIAKLRTRLKFERAECRMMVTNRRILFRASGTAVRGNVLQEHQFNLDEISGVEIHQNYRFSILSLIGSLLLMVFCTSALPALLFKNTYGARGVALGLILAILCAVPTFVMYKRFWLKSFLMDIGTGCMVVALIASRMNKFLLFLVIVFAVMMFIDIFIICFVPNLVVRVKGKTGGAAVALGSQRAMAKRSADEENTGFAEVLPWEDTIMAINELGTMIDDLQKQGDYAVEKWSK